MAVYPVITSKRAKKDYATIQAQHNDILTNLSTHTARVQQFNAEREMKNMNDVAMQEKSQNEKIALAQKQQEIDVKRAALEQPAS